MITILLLINIFSLLILAAITYILHRHNQDVKKQMQKDEQLIKQLKKAIENERRNNI